MRFKLGVRSLENNQTFPLRVDFPDLRGKGINQIRGLRNLKYCPGKFGQHLLQDFLRGQIQVIGGLIQQQEVRI